MSAGAIVACCAVARPAARARRVLPAPALPVSATIETCSETRASAAHSCSMYFEDMEVPEENRLGKDGEGFSIMMNVVLPYFQIMSAGCCLGMMEAATAKTAEATKKLADAAAALKPPRPQAFQDLLWALLNTKEFMFNH